MKIIILFGIVLMTMIVSLGGCYWGYPGHDWGEGHDRGEEHDRDGD